MTDQEKTTLKISLKEKALEILQKRIDTSSAAMSEAQFAANEEGKSSAGDKYETSRAMAQIDRDIHARQLESAKKELSFIQNVDVTLFCKRVDIGAYVLTDVAKYFFLVGLGPVDIGNDKVVFLNLSSPIGKALYKMKAKENVVFNGKRITIKELF